MTLLKDNLPGIEVAVAINVAAATFCKYQIEQEVIKKLRRQGKEGVKIFVTKGGVEI